MAVFRSERIAALLLVVAAALGVGLANSPAASALFAARDTHLDIFGFTVSLLMNELAFRGHASIASEGTLAVLAGSVVAAIIGAGVTARRAWHYRRLEA